MVPISASRIGSGALGVFYGLFGTAQVYRMEPFIDLHDNLLMKYRRFAPLFPTAPHWIPDHRLYMVTVGLVEGTAGLALLFGSKRIRKLSCIALMVLMSGAVYTLSISNYPGDQERLPAPLFCLFCLGCNYVSIDSETPPSYKKPR